MPGVRNQALADGSASDRQRFAEGRKLNNDLTLGQFITRVCERFPNHLLLNDFSRQKTYTYDQWDKDSRAFVLAMQQRGFHRGDFAMSYLGNEYSYLVAYAGVARAEGVAAPLTARLTVQEVSRLIRFVKPRWFFTDQKGWVELERFLRGSSVAWCGIYTGETWEWMETSSGQSARKPDPTLALLRFTSGSQGEVKVVMLTHRNLLYRVGNYAHYALPGDIFYLGIPFVFRPDRLIQAWSVGGEIVIQENIHPGQIVRCWLETGVTFAWLVPTIIGLLCELSPDEIPAGLRLRGVNTGGAYLYRQWEERFEELFHVPVYQQYGLSEGCVAFENPVEKRVGSVGKPTPTVEVKLCDPNTGQEVLPGQIGELLYRGENVMRGYLDRPDLTAATLRDGWLKTGDLARFDEDGYLTIEGRLKDLIHSGGLKFSPREVEEVLLRYPGMREVAVVPVAHPVKGEVAKAIYVADKRLKAGALRAFCRKWLADYKIPKQWEQVESLPKLASGKIARRTVSQA